MKNRLFLAGLLSVLVFTSSGCFLLIAGAAGGAGTAVWLSNKLTQDVNFTYERGVYAAKAALKDLKLRQTKETVEAEVAQIMGENSDGKTIWIDVKKTSDKTCRIEVRVGVLGDEAAARKVMDAVGKRL